MALPSREGPNATPPGATTDQQRHEQLLEALRQLKSVVEEQLAAIHDRLEHVAEVVRESIEETGVLRDAIDEEREVIEWAAHNDKPIFHLTSMSVDPSDPNFAQNLNAPAPEVQGPPVPLHSTQSTLF